MKKTLIILGVLAVLFGMYYFSEDHQQYLAFAVQRDVWHQQCDLYIGKPVTSAEAQDCAKRLEAMTAYAKRKGW